MKRISYHQDTKKDFVPSCLCGVFNLQGGRSIKEGQPPIDSCFSVSFGSVLICFDLLGEWRLMNRITLCSAGDAAMCQHTF